ncbi:chloramphenicol 3-O phosphotransferase [Streptomyces sp. TLI_053]|uniref:chloramphenicol phosphotransferase CPT family protein n=1 Tax=Streptomyces sp. TLI_053 TaxID=1855352 RepID=UPI00087A88EB|nr:AAA family ATPase [Streptomyces sp. TLI_053]SDS74125.1 chloramphenicol 3-O phosphotransferase [Streptomyces sp. TLI_053]
MRTQVIVLNGGSSSGKTTLARALQELLPGAWLAFGVDILVDALPARLRDGADGIAVETETVTVGDTFRLLDTAWAHGIAAMARAGARVVVDDVFLGGPASQQRWRDALDGLDVLWVGVHCAPEVAAAREAARGDRAEGMAAAQALAVHGGIDYDLTVDTGTHPIAWCAAQVASVVAARVAAREE